MQDNNQIAELEVCEQCAVGNADENAPISCCAHKPEKTIVLYSTNCPRCTVLEKKLIQNGIEFKKNTMVDEMIVLGIKQAPMLLVDGELLDFSAANEWLNKIKQEGTA
jgi:hypothetical protein